MELLAHRGWSMGKGVDWSENTLSAFKKSAEEVVIKGVEIDVRRHPETKELILSHDAVDLQKSYLSLEDALSYASGQDWRVLIECKECDVSTVSDITAVLIKNGRGVKPLIFGFLPIAKKFPWLQKREVPLGMIVEYPWQIQRVVKKYKPDTILLGWDDRTWTKYAFKIWWSIFSLRRVRNRHKVDIIAGVVDSSKDIPWLKSRGVTLATMDMAKAAY